MARVRDYKAEYLRRKTSGLARGLTLGQARGHPEAGKLLASAKSAVTSANPKLEEGIKLVRNGQSVSSAAKSINVSAERLRNYAIGQGVGQKVSGRWKIAADNRLRQIEVYSGGKKHTIVVNGYEPSKLVGEYMDSVRKFLQTNDPAHLDPYRGVSVKDVKGKRYVFETDENILYKLNSTGDEPFESVYQIVV